MLKKLACLCLALAMTLSLAASAQAEEEKVLNIFTWDSYIDGETLQNFTSETGIKINYTPFSTNEEMLAKLQMNGGSEYDLVLASDYVLNILRKDGLLLKLDKVQLSNYVNLNPFFLNQYYDPDGEYTIPYTAGSPLIIYDPALVDIEITGYEDLWNPALKDSIVLVDDARNILGVTLKTMGKSMNETDPAVLEQAKEKLMPLYANVRAFDYDTPYNLMISGEAAVGYMFTPYLQIALTERPDLKVVTPKEGLGFGIDSLVIPVNAPHPNNAHLLINYLMDGEVAAHVAQMQYYLNPNQAAEQYIPEEFLSSPAFIPVDQLEGAEFIKDVGDAESLFQEIWTEFKMQ